MSARSKTRIASIVLLFVLTTAATAAPSRDSGSGDFFDKIGRVIKQIVRVLRPLEEPSLPKP